MYIEASGSKVSDKDLLSVPTPHLVTSLRLDQTSITDAGIMALLSMSHLANLQIDSTLITDAALPYIAKCTKLEGLYICNANQISDDGVSQLSVLDKLGAIQLESMSISGSFLRKTWNRWPRLWSLSLASTDLQDINVEIALRMPTLRVFSAGFTTINCHSFGSGNRLEMTHLYLDDTNVDDISIRTIVANCPRLRNLTVARSKITDESIRECSKIKTLELLRVSGTGITENGLRFLKGHSALQGIEASGCRVSKATVKELKSHCPALTMFVV